MIHLLSVIGILAAVAVLAAVTYRLAGAVTSRRLPRSAAAGLAAAAALVLWVGTVQHAALVKSAAEPMRNGQKLTPGFILADGGVFTFLVFTVAVAAVTAALDRRRAARRASTGVMAISGRGRQAARTWGKP